jgi:type I restriction enzyme S subunit
MNDINLDIPKGCILARGFDWDSVRFPPRQVGTFCSLNYGKSLVEGLRKQGIIPIYGTNGQCGWHDQPLSDGPGVILGRKGQGHLGVKWSSSPFWVIDTAYYANVDREQADIRWFYYITKYVGLDQLKTGEKPGLPRELFCRQLFPYPSLDKQRDIARILGSLDDKIELNRRINRTLETMAQAIFRSWFVDFEPVSAKRDGRKPVGMDDATAALFPEHFQETDMGTIPLGWSYGTLSDLAKITSGKRPGQRSTTRTSDMVIPIFGGGGMMGYTDQALCTSKMLLTGRVGTLGLIFRISEPCWPSDNTLILTCADRDHEYVYQVIQETDFDSLNRGSSQPLVTQGDLLALKVLLPSSEILERYHAITVSMFNKIDRNKNSIDTLAALRDSLLPQLLSGELRVGQAEKIVEEAS